MALEAGNYVCDIQQAAWRNTPEIKNTLYSFKKMCLR